MTNEEAEELLKKLSEHYGQPVMPVQTYCKALQDWQRAVERGQYTDYSPNGTLSEAIGRTFMAIQKSNLLYRLIYLGEKPRMKKCPVHDGHWSGCRWDEPHCDCQMLENGSYNADVTGWLPEPTDRE